MQPKHFIGLSEYLAYLPRNHGLPQSSQARNSRAVKQNKTVDQQFQNSCSQRPKLKMISFDENANLNLTIYLTYLPAQSQ